MTAVEVFKASDTYRILTPHPNKQTNNHHSDFAQPPAVCNRILLERKTFANLICCNPRLVRSIAMPRFNVLAEAMEAHAEHLGRSPQFFDAEIITYEERVKDVEDDAQAFAAWCARYKERMERKSKVWWLCMPMEEIKDWIYGSPLIHDLKCELIVIVDSLTTVKIVDVDAGECAFRMQGRCDSVHSDSDVTQERCDNKVM